VWEKLLNDCLFRKNTDFTDTADTTEFLVLWNTDFTDTADTTEFLVL